MAANRRNITALAAILTESPSYDPAGDPDRAERLAGELAARGAFAWSALGDEQLKAVARVIGAFELPAERAEALAALERIGRGEA
jgi:hypothetical protein